MAATAQDMLVQALGEIARRLRDMSDPATATIHGFYKEAYRLVDAYDKRKMFGLRPASVSVIANIAAIATASAQTDNKFSENENFVVSEVRGYLAINDWDNELAVAATLGTNAAPSDRVVLKAYNAKLNIKNLDSKVDVTDTSDLVLASILPETGGAPLRFGGEGRPAWIIPHGQTIRMKVTLATTTAAYTQKSTDYGVTLSGVFISRQQQ